MNQRVIAISHSPYKTSLNKKRKVCNEYGLIYTGTESMTDPKNRTKAFNDK